MKSRKPQKNKPQQKAHQKKPARSHPPLCAPVFYPSQIPHVASVSEFSTYTRQHQETVYRLIRAGKLFAIRHGGSYRIPVHNLWEQP